MTQSVRPINHGERATCLAAVARLLGWTGVHAAVSTLITTDFQPIAVAYEAARVANDGAALAATVATDRRAAADLAFAAALKRWLHSAYAATGQTEVQREIRPLMGNLPPTKFLTQAVRTRLEQMPRLDLVARSRPALTGDLALLDALRGASVTLEDRVTASEAATADHSRTSAALDAATAAFDRSYGAVARTVRMVDPVAAGSVLPTFHRAARVPAAPMCAAEAPMPFGLVPPAAADSEAA
ncbi:MAG: hypothetical protein ABMB14_32635 [Myxococcota bacterium]